MRTRAAFIALLLLFPSATFAAGFGFPREPLWVSASTAHEGETITMYVALYNASTEELKGTVSYLADGTVFESKDVSLAAGESSLFAGAWKAVKGPHTLSATFVSGTSKDATQKISVTISDPPPAPPTKPIAINQAVQSVENFAAPLFSSSSPIGKVAGAVVEKAEGVRTAGAAAIRPYATPKKSSLPLNTALITADTSASSLVDKGSQLAASGLLFAFDTKWLFYFLALLLFYLFIRLLKRIATRHHT